MAAPILSLSKTSRVDSSRLASIQTQIDSFCRVSNYSQMTLAYIQRSKLENKIYGDTTESIFSLRKAIQTSKKSGDINLEFYSLYKLKHLHYTSNIVLKYSKLDTVIQHILDNHNIEDSLRYSIHLLWGNNYAKYNYHFLALNEYLNSKNIAFSLNDSAKITKSLIHLLRVYNILKDDDLYDETQTYIESYIPANNADLQVSYYLALRSFEYRYNQLKSESFLKKALHFSSKSKKSDFSIHKELAIYYIQNLKIDSALSEISYLEKNYLNYSNSRHWSAKIHIEELYARLYYNTNDFSRAQIKYKNAISLCDEKNSPFLKRRLLLLALKITKDIDDFRMAFEALRSLKLLEDSTVNRSQIVEYQKLKNKLYRSQMSKKISVLEYNEKISNLNLRNQNKNIIWLTSVTIALAAIILVIFISYNQKRMRSRELQALNNLKDFIFSVISHDLRSPLYNFNTLLNMAENRYLKEEEYSEYLKIIQGELKGITGVTESLLRWAKSNQGLLKVNLSRISLMDVLAEVKDVFRHELVKKNIHIISNFIYDIEIKTDKDLFTFILRNILQNAIKFSESGRQIEINAIKENGSIIVEVVDHGAGMSEEQVENINRQISNPSSDIAGVKSTGLGLIIAKDFAKRLNIKNEIKSVVGKGTSIRLSFDSVPQEQD